METRLQQESIVDPSVPNDLKGEKRNLVDLLVKIPLFEDFVPKECLSLLAVCKQAAFGPGTEIYEAGSPGNQMLILLKGKVRIVVPDGTTIAEVNAVDTVGELEIATSGRRLASVVADGDVAGLTLTKGAFEQVIQTSPFLGIKLLRNVLNNVTRKLAATNRDLASRIDSSSKP